MDLYLDPVTHDLAIFAGGHTRLTSGVPEAAAQRVLIMLRMFAGEWFLDLLAGIPYYQSILVKNPDLSAVKAILRQKLEADAYVSAVTQLTLELDTPTRVMTCAFSARLEDGSELEILTGIGTGAGLVATQVTINGIAITVGGEGLTL